jgi:tripartite ATP-independent transporter DctP family solute receptor
MMKAVKSAMRSAMLVAAFLTAPALAQIQDRTLKVGIGLNDDHPQAMAVRRFGEIVEKKTNGKIKVKLFSGGSLGNDATMISALRGGTQEMTVPDTSTLVSLVKDFGVINFPFVFATEQEADAVLEGPFGAKLLAKLPDKNLVGLAIWENGFRHVTNSKRPINTAADLSGLKLRVIQNALFIDTFSALGANALPMPFPEVYTALEQKTVDGQENPTATVLASKFYEVQKHLALTKHIYSVWALLVSKKAWDSMSPEERTIIQDAAKEATQYERATIRAFSNKALDELKAKGMQVTELSAAEQASMRTKLKPVIDKYSKEFGEDTAKEMLAEIEKARKK